MYAYADILYLLISMNPYQLLPCHNLILYQHASQIYNLSWLKYIDMEMFKVYLSFYESIPTYAAWEKQKLSVLQKPMYPPPFGVRKIKNVSQFINGINDSHYL